MNRIASIAAALTLTFSGSFAPGWAVSPVDGQEAPMPHRPVVWSAAARQVDPGTIELKVEYRLFPEWYIYVSAPQESPYTTTLIEVELPKGASFAGEWTRPPTKVLQDRVLISDKDGVFTRRVKLPADSRAPLKLPVSVTWQTCDPEQCLPPETKKMVVEVGRQ